MAGRICYSHVLSKWLLLNNFIGAVNWFTCIFATVINIAHKLLFMCLLCCSRIVEFMLFLPQTFHARVPFLNYNTRQLINSYFLIYE